MLVDFLLDDSLSVSILNCRKFCLRFIARCGTPIVFLRRPQRGLKVGGMLFDKRTIQGLMQTLSNKLMRNYAIFIHSVIHRNKYMNEPYLHWYIKQYNKSKAYKHKGINHLRNIPISFQHWKNCWWEVLTGLFFSNSCCGPYN